MKKNVLTSCKLIKTIPVKQEFIKDFNRIPPSERDTDSIFCNHLVMQLYCNKLLKISQNHCLKFVEFSYETHKFLHKNKHEKWNYKETLNLTLSSDEDETESKLEISQSEKFLFKWNFPDDYIQELKKKKIFQITTWVELASKKKAELINRLNYLIPKFPLQNLLFATQLKNFDFNCVEF